jgi:hypothetical protein
MIMKFQNLITYMDDLIIIWIGYESLDISIKIRKMIKIPINCYNFLLLIGYLITYLYA